MTGLTKLSIIAVACLCPYAATAQTADSVTLVLVTWMQGGAASTSQSFIGTFSDVPKCIIAAQKMQISNGATQLSINFICVPNK